jgi:hypothetical protein
MSDPRSGTDPLITLAAQIVVQAVRDARSNHHSADEARGWLAEDGVAWIDALGMNGEALVQKQARRQKKYTTRTMSQ